MSISFKTADVMIPVITSWLVRVEGDCQFPQNYYKALLKNNSIKIEFYNTSELQLNKAMKI